MAITSPRVWLDGALTPKSAASLPILAQATQRGSLVFDVGSFHPVGDRVALFRAPEHVQRLLRSAAIVGLEVPFDATTLVDAARRVVDASGLREGLLRWSVCYAAPEPDLLPRDPNVTVVVAAQALEDGFSVAPVAVAVFDDARKAAPEALSPAAKAAAAYLGPALAKRRARAAGADEVLLLDVEGGIAEAPTANAFAVVNGELVTPSLRFVLGGITRDTVLTLAREDGIACREGAIAKGAFAGATEAFLTATSLPIAPIHRVNDDRLPSAPGPVTAKVSARLFACLRGDHHLEWLTPVR